MKTQLTEQLLKEWKSKNLINPDEMLFIDVRSPEEFRQEHIPGSINIPLDQLAQFDFSPYKNKKIILYCRSGVRSQQAMQCVPSDTESYCLEDGIVLWKQCQLPTNKKIKAPIDVMQQVQIIIGSLVLLGIILAYTVSPYFIILSAFMAGGLLMAGITGYCGLAKLVAKLPWNQS